MSQEPVKAAIERNRFTHLFDMGTALSERYVFL